MDLLFLFHLRSEWLPAGYFLLLDRWRECCFWNLPLLPTVPLETRLLLFHRTFRTFRKIPIRGHLLPCLPPCVFPLYHRHHLLPLPLFLPLPLPLLLLALITSSGVPWRSWTGTPSPASAFWANWTCGRRSVLRGIWCWTSRAWRSCSATWTNGPRCPTPGSWVWRPLMAWTSFHRCLR